MREFSTPITFEIPESGSLTDALVENAVKNPQAVALSRWDGDSWVPVTAQQFHDEVRALAKGLVAAGVRQGDRVALLSRTRYEWTLVDYAIWYVGAVCVPAYDTSSAAQLAWMLQDSGARALVVETDAHRALLDESRNEVPELEHVWTIEDSGLDEIAAAGNTVTDSSLDERRAAVTPDTPATIIYTSGTTGEPKGCVLTHGNFLVEVEGALDVLDVLFADEDASTLLFLPLAHVFARILQVGAIRAGVRLGHSRSAATLVSDLESFRPTFLLAVPRVFEKIFTTAYQRAAADGHGATFAKAVDVAIAYSQALDGRGPGPWLRARHKLFDRLVYTPLRTTLGGHCEYAVSGGAPLGERLGHFFRGIGLTVLEGYGLTETTGAVTVNRPEGPRIGTVGQPLPGTTLRIAEDGELLVSGGSVMAGYWQDAGATSQVLTDDGWFRTGDVAEIDDEGYLRITGRMKEIIVTAGGKNVAPAVLEDRIRSHPLVAQCLVVGDGRPFIAAVVTLDADATAVWAGQNGKPTRLKSLVDDADLRHEIQGAVDDANATVSQAEAVRRFVILPGNWTEEGGQLTPSLKVKRSVVLREARDAIERLYRG